MPTPSERYLTVKHYAQKYDCSVHTVFKWRAAGLLDVIQVGRRFVRVADRPPDTGQSRFPRRKTA